MKFIPCFIFLGFIYNQNVLTHALQGPEDTTVEEFPYQVSVVGSSICSAILISENLVITPAECVVKSPIVSVYLGFNSWSFLSNRKEHNTQMYTSTDIVVHENFTQSSSSNNFNNNIALIRLPKAVTKTSNVHPGTLISKEEAAELAHNFVTMSGWVDQKDVIQTTKIRILNQDTCSNFFGAQFLRSQELCAETSSKTVSYVGNAVSWKDKIIGYIVWRHKCVMPTVYSGTYETILNLVPYLHWISEKGNITIAELTGQNLDDAFTKIENLEDAMKNLQAIKLEISNARMIETKNNNNNREDINKMNVQLSNIISKHLQELKTEISNAKMIETKNEKKCQEQINKMNVELKSIIRKQNDRSECEAKCDSLERNIYLLSNEIKSVNEKITKIRNFINDPPPE